MISLIITLCLSILVTGLCFNKMGEVATILLVITVALTVSFMEIAIKRSTLPKDNPYWHTTEAHSDLCTVQGVAEGVITDKNKGHLLNSRIISAPKLPCTIKHKNFDKEAFCAKFFNPSTGFLCALSLYKADRNEITLYNQWHKKDEEE